MILVPVICMTKGVFKRYMAARKWFIKASKYRPSKYKQVSPSQAPSPTALGDMRI